MKKLLFITLLTLFSFSAKAQEKTYVELFYGTVKNENVENHIKNEKATFAKMHADRIKRGEIVGWDMWKMVSPGDTQGTTTFLYATIYTDMDKANLWGTNTAEYIKRAAGKNLAGFNAKLKAVLADYTTENEVITSVKGFENFNGNNPMSSYLVLNSMVVDAYHEAEYEKMELETFKAFRKGNDKLKGWNLQKILNAAGDNKVNYYTVDFYSSLKDIFDQRDNTNDFSEATVKMLKDIDKIRTLKSADIFMLIDTKR